MYIKVPYMFPLFPSSPFFISFNTSFFNTFQAPPFLHPWFPFMVKTLPESRSDIHSLHWTDTPWMPQIKLDSLNFCYCLILKARRFSSDNGFLPPGKSLDLLRALHQSVAMITKCIKDQGVQRVPYLLWLPLIRWNAINNFRTQLIIMEVHETLNSLCAHHTTGFPVSLMHLVSVHFLCPHFSNSTFVMTSLCKGIFMIASQV